MQPSGGYVSHSVNGEIKARKCAKSYNIISKSLYNLRDPTEVT